MNRNEKYDGAIESIQNQLQEEHFTEARDLCKSMLDGELKYRCENALFWKLYAEAEKVYRMDIVTLRKLDPLIL